MCLTKVTSTHSPPKKGRAVGYKIFDIDGYGRIMPWMWPDWNGCALLRTTTLRYEPNVWYESYGKPTRLMTTINENHYPAGFHIFTTKAAARTWSGRISNASKDTQNALFRVEYDQVVAEGNEEFDTHTVIALEMRVLDRIVE